MNVTLYLINLGGGGGDIACGGCLAEAKKELAVNSRVISTGRIDSTSDACGWCGAEQSDAA